MANTCIYKMRIKGKRQDVIDALHYIHGSGPLSEVEVKTKRNIGTDREVTTKGVILQTGFVGRCGYEEADILIREKDGLMLAELDDECAWSVMSAMIDMDDSEASNRKGLEELASLYDVKMEIYSTEYGVGFCEYYYFPGKDTEEQGYTEEDFNHEEVVDVLREEGYHVNDDGDWVDANNTVCPDAFDDKLNELFPWEWQELCGDEWNTRDLKALKFGKFVSEYKGSWE